MNFARTDNRYRRRFESLERRWLLAGDIVINEFMASNSGSLRDFEGDSADWIELYNRGTQSVDLAGWHLSDDATNLTKWQIPSRTLAPGDFLVIFASGKNLQSTTELHTDFRLRSAGEFLSLTRPDGASITSSYSPSYPPQHADVSYGFGSDGVGAPSFLIEPTPGATNSPNRLAETVSFSHELPTFTAPFLLALQGARADQTIAYTLDGTVPTADSPVYDAPLLIDQTIQVRARVVEGAQLGSVATQGYSRLSPEVAAFTSSLPIMLIENFGAGSIPLKGFPDQTGANTIRPPRQPGMITLVEPDLTSSSRLTSAPNLHSRMGIRIRGAFSATFSEPGYALEFWDEADADVNVSPLHLTSDSDWVLYAPNPEIDSTLIDNTFLFSISREMGHWAPAFQYVETFLNTDGESVTMDDHVGLYVFEDKVSRGPDRIDFERLSTDGSEGGWMLTVNRMDAIPADNVNAVPQHFHTVGPDGILETPPNSPGMGDDIPRQYNAFLNFEDPDGYRINADQRLAIETWFADMEALFYGRTETRWNDPQEGYASYIDVDSFIDYFILNNLSNNGDGFLLSMWVYNPDPNGQGKLTMGPIWDADLGSFSGHPTSRVRDQIDRLWYGRLFEDADFVQQYADRWFELRRDTLSIQYLHQTIDSLMGTITVEAAERDGVADWPTRLSEMKSWLARRVPAIDQTFVQPPVLRENATGIGISGDGDVFYTLDGSDPRQSGGLPSASAMLLTNDTVPLNAAATVVARVFADGRWSAPTRISVQQPGDTNQDGQLNAEDIDYLLAAVARGAVEPDLDLNSDDSVDEADVTFLVETVFKTRVGDSNLDQRVDFSDFLRLSASFGTDASWSNGNFNSNPLVDFTDFLLLAANVGFEA